MAAAERLFELAEDICRDAEVCRRAARGLVIGIPGNNIPKRLYRYADLHPRCADELRDIAQSMGAMTTAEHDAARDKANAEFEARLKAFDREREKERLKRLESPEGRLNAHAQAIAAHLVLRQAIDVLYAGHGTALLVERVGKIYELTDGLDAHLEHVNQKTGRRFDEEEKTQRAGAEVIPFNRTVN